VLIALESESPLPNVSAQTNTMKTALTAVIALMNVPLVKTIVNVSLVLPTPTDIRTEPHAHVKTDTMTKVLQPVPNVIPNAQPVQPTKPVLHVLATESYQNAPAQRANGTTITIVKIVTINVKDVTPVLPTAPGPMIAPPTD
jgi:hypothetical protein